jgi:hypothetical protein
VKVHKNLNRGCWTLTRAAGSPVEHANAAALADVRFVVQPGGLARVRKTGVRAVHAYCIGTEVTAPVGLGGLTEVTYNPFRADTFTTRDGRPVRAADLVVFHTDGRAYAGGIR